MTMQALTFLLHATRWSSHMRVLDLGCGNGKIAEFISDVTGAHVTGMDYIPDAVMCANARTCSKRERLDFFAGDITRLACAPHSFDALLSIDSLYFSAEYAATLQEWAECVCQGGELAIFFSHGADPEHPKKTFDKATLPPDMTPPGVALRTLGMKFETWDFTENDYALAKRKKKILETLRDEFQAEGNSFLYDNRMGETAGVLDAIESGMHARYLYLVRPHHTAISGRAESAR